MAYKNARNDLTAEYVRSILDYDPETGRLTWKKAPPGHPNWLGKPAGHVSSRGRHQLRINYRLYYAHRIIWLIMTSEWPPEEVDHCDRNESNNRWSNIRLASSSENRANHNLRADNKSGYTGVFFVKSTGRYTAYIKWKGKREHLGCFDTAEEAYSVRCRRAMILHGKFATP